MDILKRFDCLTAGLAIFAMFFGAGNIIFPLALAQFALDKAPFAFLGLLLTAVVIPFAGLIAIFRYGGNVQLFFGRLGKIPGLVVSALTIALLGPFGAAPRCVALAHSTISTSMTGVPLIVFSSIACLVIFCFAYRQTRLLKLLGTFIAPFKIMLLVWIIVKGCIEAPDVVLECTAMSETALFWHGLKEGCNTMDLLSAFFFAPLILYSVGGDKKDKGFEQLLIKASGIGGGLLALVYLGFGYLAYLYTPQLQGFSSDQLLGAIAVHVLGPYAGWIVSATVMIACLTTAIALIAAFANFIDKEILREKVGYVPVLFVSVVMMFGVITLEFQGIARFLSPILETCYPGFILLTLYNLFIPRRLLDRS